MAGGAGFFLGGLSDTLNQGLSRNQQAQFQQQELQVQQQGQQMAQKRFEMAQMDKLLSDVGDHLLQTIDAGKVAGEDPKKISAAISGMVDQYRKLSTAAGRPPDLVDAQINAAFAAPPSTQVMQAQAAAKEPPGQADLRKSQSEYYKAQAKLIEPDDTTAGGNTFAPGTKLGASSVQDIPPGAPLPIPGGQTAAGGTKYIATPYTGKQKAIIANSGATPDQFDFDAVQYAYGNTAVAQGYRSYKGVNPATVLRSRASQYWMDKGMTPEQANAAMVEFAAMKHGANTAATIDARMTESLTKAANTAQVVMPLAAKVDRTKYKDFNDFMVNVRKRTGNQDEIRLGIALETLATNYGTSLGMGNSVLTDTKLKQAQDMLQQGWNQGQLGAAVDQIMQELKREEAGTRQGMRMFLGGMSDMQSGGSGAAPDTGQPPAQGGGISGSSGNVRFSFTPGQ